MAADEVTEKARLTSEDSIAPRYRDRHSVGGLCRALLQSRCRKSDRLSPSSPGPSPPGADFRASGNTTRGPPESACRRVSRERADTTPDGRWQASPRRSAL